MKRVERPLAEICLSKILQTIKEVLTVFTTKVEHLESQTTKRQVFALNLSEMEVRHPKGLLDTETDTAHNSKNCYLQLSPL